VCVVCVYNTDFNLVNCSNCARPHKRRRSRNYLITSNFPVPLPLADAASSLSSPTGTHQLYINIYHHHRPVATTPCHNTHYAVVTTPARQHLVAYSTLLSQTRPYPNVVIIEILLYTRHGHQNLFLAPVLQLTFRYCWYYYHTIVRRRHRYEVE